MSDECHEITSEIGPWAMVPAWVLEVGLTGNELAVYVALRSFADRRGAAYPHVKTIADRAGCSERTVARALQRFRELDLMDSGRLYKDDGSIRGCWYRLHDVRRGTVAPPPCQGWHHPPDTGDTTPLSEVAEQNTPREHTKEHRGGARGVEPSPPSGELPPRFCEDHPAGTATPCRACGTAGRAHDLAAQRLTEARDRERHDRLVADDLAARRSAAPPPIGQLRAAVRKRAGSG